MRIDEKPAPFRPESSPSDPPAKLTIRQRLYEWVRPKNDPAHPPLGDVLATAPERFSKPASKSKPIPAWMRGCAGKARGVDRDGQVLNPSSSQRSMAGLLSQISPRTRD